MAKSSPKRAPKRFVVQSEGPAAFVVFDLEPSKTLDGKWARVATCKTRRAAAAIAAERAQFPDDDPPEVSP